jgi:pantoate--beta-alanine ligase
MSSRNARLSPHQREAAAVLYRGICAAREAIRSGAFRADEIIARAKEVIEAEPQVQIDYVALCDPDSLEPINRLEKRGVILLAAKVGGVRLIDNRVVTRPPKRRKGASKNPIDFCHGERGGVG